MSEQIINKKTSFEILLKEDYGIKIWLKDGEFLRTENGYNIEIGDKIKANGFGKFSGFFPIEDRETEGFFFGAYLTNYNDVNTPNTLNDKIKICVGWSPPDYLEMMTFGRPEFVFFDFQVFRFKQ